VTPVRQSRWEFKRQHSHPLKPSPVEIILSNLKPREYCSAILAREPENARLPIRKQDLSPPCDTTQISFPLIKLALEFRIIFLQFRGNRGPRT
jgi:hypothetical protein